jgi:hypothetical protein
VRKRNPPTHVPPPRTKQINRLVNVGNIGNVSPLLMREMREEKSTSMRKPRKDVPHLPNLPQRTKKTIISARKVQGNAPANIPSTPAISTRRRDEVGSERVRRNALPRRTNQAGGLAKTRIARRQCRGSSAHLAGARTRSAAWREILWRPPASKGEFT